MARPRIRGCGGVASLRSCQGRIIRNDSVRNLRRLVDSGDAVELENGSFQLVEFMRVPDATQGAITAAETRAAVGEFGRSATANLSEAARDARERAGLVAEDFIERSAAKVRHYSGSAAA